MHVLKVVVYELREQSWGAHPLDRWEAFSPHNAGLALRGSTPDAAAHSYFMH